VNLVLFVLTIIVSFAVVRVGAIAFELTGMSWQLAKFQALSCFTSTGFTTSEAELITSTPRRRRIASFLMILGNAGFITLIATFANTIRAPEVVSDITLPYLDLVVPTLMLPVVNLAVIGIAVYLVYRVFSIKKRFGRLRRFVVRRITGSRFVEGAEIEDLVVVVGGRGVFQIAVELESALAGITLHEVETGARAIDVLAIVRGSEVIDEADASFELLPGDKIVAFGERAAAYELLKNSSGTS